MNSGIEFKNVNFYYNRRMPSEVWALKNLNFDIKQGDYVTFFGPSGCGKTTLLYLMAGIDTDHLTEGEVMVNGRDIGKFDSQELAVFRQLGIGIVFQQFNLIPSLTVLDNVALPMSFFGVTLERRQKEAQRLLDRLAIGQLAKRFPSELSGGQQQRVGIARALANNPPIIIADEPLGNLDSENANIVLAFLKELNEKDKRTIIMVTHEVWSLRDAKRIFHMKDGSIIKISEQEEKASERAASLSAQVMQQIQPELAGQELAARSLSMLLMRGYTGEEIRRCESFIIQRLAGELDSPKFKELLDLPYKKGGVGMYAQRAAHISVLIDDLLARRKDISTMLKELEANPYVTLGGEIAQMRDWLLTEYHGKVSDEQKYRLDEIINDRLRNAIGPDDFREILNLSCHKSGVGLTLHASRMIAQKMSFVLQKGYSIGAQFSSA